MEMLSGPQHSAAVHEMWYTLMLKFIQLGALDGTWECTGFVAGIRRSAMTYLSPLILPPTAWTNNDPTNWRGLLRIVNYIISPKRNWQDSSNGESVARRNSTLAMCHVIKAVDITMNNFPAASTLNNRTRHIPYVIPNHTLNSGSGDCLPSRGGAVTRIS